MVFGRASEIPSQINVDLGQPTAKFPSSFTHIRELHVLITPFQYIRRTYYKYPPRDSRPPINIHYSRNNIRFVNNPKNQSVFSLLVFLLPVQPSNPYTLYKVTQCQAL